MKKNISSRVAICESPFRVLATCSAICVLLSASGFAQTWTGGGLDDNWNTAANWSTLPLNDNTANITFSGSTRLTPFVNVAEGVKQVIFDSGASAFNIGGNQTLTLASTLNAPTTAALINNSSVLQTVSTNLAFVGAANNRAFFATSGDLLISGNLLGTNRIVLNNNGVAHDITISGTMTGAGSAGNSLLLDSPFRGTATLSGANTYSGATVIRSGTLIAKHNTALGTSVVSIGISASGLAANALFIGGAYSVANTVNVGNTYNGTVSVGGNTADSSTFSGNLTLGDTAGKAVTLTAASGGTVNFSGNLLTSTSGSDDLDAITKSGAGTVNLSGTGSNYSGNTTVSEGMLLVNNSSGSATGTGAVTVSTGAALGGSGIISGSVTVNSGGALSPGNSPGLLTVGSLVLDSGSNTLMQIDTITTRGTTYDAIDVNNAVTFGGTLSIDLTGAATIGTYSLFGFASQSGTFSAINFLNAGAAGTFNYAAGELSLTAIPEPAPWALLAFSLTTVLVFRRRRKS
ncbi:MAG: autotransporter-associated beta strand repeat-containing protein [Phycisphaerae bacterium]|jgi:autotransporter-associated beta strand protein